MKLLKEAVILRALMSRSWWLATTLSVLTACSGLRGDVLYQCDDGGSCPAGFQCGRAPSAGGGATPGAVCLPVDAGAGIDAGADAGLDAGADAGFDAGADAGFDAGADAGFDAGADAGFDAGADAGRDAGSDAGVDAGPSCPTRCPVLIPGTCSLVTTDPRCEPLHCGQPCDLGLSCSPAGRCEVNPVCVDGWCADYPLPQGNHLTAAHAEARAFDGGAFFVWGGEQGMLFEWNSVTTRARPLSGARGHLLGFIGNTANALRAVTSRGQVFLRTDAGAWTLENSVEATVDECAAARDFGAGLLLGCSGPRDGGGRVATLYEVGLSGPGALRALVLTGDAGFDPVEVTALVRTRGTPSMLVFARSASTPRTRLYGLDVGGNPLPFPTPQVDRPDAGQLPLDTFLGTDRLSASRRIGNEVFLGSANDDYTGAYIVLQDVQDGGPWRWEGDRTLALNDVDAIGGQPVLATRVLVLAGPTFGNLPLDADLLPLVPRQPSPIVRSWNALATANDTVLAVGAFGATAVYRAGDASVVDGGVLLLGELRSSPITARPTDLCGPSDGGEPFMTFSANDFPFSDQPAGWPARRLHDGVVLSEDPSSASWSGVWVRSDGGWAPVPKALTSLWSPTTDQCFVDERGRLHALTPPLAHTLGRDGGWTSTLLPHLFRDAGYEYVGLFVDDTDEVYTSPVEAAVGVGLFDGGRLVLRRLLTSIGNVAATSTTAVHGVGPGVIAGVWDRLAVRDGGVWESIDLTSQFRGFIHGRTTRDGGSTAFTGRYSVGNGSAGLWAYTGTSCGMMSAMTCALGFVREQPLPSFRPPLRAWVDFDERPWLLTVDTGADVLPLDATYQVMKVAADGGLTTLPVPGYWHLPHAWNVGATLWGTRDALYLQGPRGVLRRSKP